MLKGWSKRHVKNVVEITMSDVATLNAIMELKNNQFGDSDTEKIVVGTFEKIANNCRYAIHKVTGRDYFAERIADERFPAEQPGNKKGTKK